jgi:glutathione S-transferase
MKNVICLEDFMSTHTFFANDRISIADFYLAFVLASAIAMINKSEQPKLVNVVRYINTISGLYPELGKISPINFADNF